MMVRRIIILGALLAFGSVSVARQNIQAGNAIQVGKSCPDFTLDNVNYYSKNVVRLNDFRGKWLFLDFWFTGCSTCIRSFPKISGLQREFRNENVQFLLVGFNAKRSGRNIQEMFEKLRIKQRLDIASAYDSTLAFSWGITSMPHIIVVDPNGIVRHVTDGRDMDSDKIRALISGKSVTFYSKDVVARQFEPELKTAGTNDILEQDILTHSLLVKWRGEEMNVGYGEVSRYVQSPDWDKVGLNLAGVSLEWLYSLAYLGKTSGLLKFWGDPMYGKVYPFAVLELKDPKQFKAIGDDKVLYNYFLSMPSGEITSESLMKYMQKDLEKVFPYRAIVEEREMPVWKLVSNTETEKRIRTKGGARYYSAEEGNSIVAGFSVKNVALKDYIMYLCFYLNDIEPHPFIDATGIKYNIDLTIEADLTNMDDVKRELKKHGLDIIKGTLRMPALIIKD